MEEVIAKTNDCKRIGNPSDQMFFLANQVASQLSENNIEAQVSLYAYAKHAKVPKFKLPDNVHVRIIPYRFQKAYKPDEMIDKWVAFHHNLSIYDYWKLPAANFNNLKGNFLQEVPKKLRHWHSKGLKGYMIETTNSKFATGFWLYIASQLSWDIEKNENEIFDEFLLHCFPNSYQEMKLFFKLWQIEVKIDGRMATSIHYLNQAERQAKSQTEKSRIEELKLFMAFVKKINIVSQSRGTEEFELQRLELLGLIWSLQPTGIIHSNAMHERVMRKFFKKEEVRGKAYGRPSKKSKSINKIAPYLTTNFDSILTSLNGIAAAAPSNDFNFLPQPVQNDWDITLAKVGSFHLNSLDHTTIKIQALFNSKKQKNTKITVLDDLHTVVLEQNIRANQREELSWKAKKNTNYTINIERIRSNVLFSSGQSYPVFVKGTLMPNVKSSKGFLVTNTLPTEATYKTKGKLATITNLDGIPMRIEVSNNTATVKNSIFEKSFLIRDHKEKIRFEALDNVFLVGKNFTVQ